jgi:hypothetical protein
MQSYPSAEDVAKALKPRSDPRQVLDNILYTKWGIWEFYAEIKDTVDKNTLNFLAKSYSGLYHITERGRGELSRSIMPFIDSYITQLEYMLQKYKFTIHFTPWEKLRGQGIYYLRRRL